MRFLVAAACLLVGLAECFQNGDVKLYPDFLEGRLEVYLNGEWGSVCYDADQDQKGLAQTVCRQLGQRNYLHVMRLSDKPGYEDNNTVPVLAKVNCRFSGNSDYGEDHILRCSSSAEIEDIQCEVGDEVFIECGSEARDAEPYNTMVRLAKLAVQEVSSGFLEIYLNKVWGSVCNMNLPDADTACRQLGYTGAVSVDTMTNYTMNPSVLDKFTCETAENCLRKCFDYPKEDDVIDCENDEASFVTCTFDEDKRDAYGSRSSCQDGGLSAGAIAGIAVGSVVGVVVLLVVVMGALFCLLPMCKSKKTKYDAI